MSNQIIILGGGGDLSRRKLLPALFDLFCRGMLPKDFSIVGLARSPRSNAEYQEFVREALLRHLGESDYPTGKIEEFCGRLSYLSGSFDESETYEKLAVALGGPEITTSCVCSNRLFYLAVPPRYYEEIFVNLKKSGLTDVCDGSWARILVEKPFGDNYETAQALDAKLASLYAEEQIFRIDHYLAKEAVQNILSFRFANRLTQATWNKDSIESVTITMTETIDVGDRVGFYEGIGALRDVGQNHLLQLLALIAMREPEEFTTEAIRNARVTALQALKQIPKGEFVTKVLRGQYIGYQEHLGDILSDTETYFELVLELEMPEWIGVPFYIRSGKALDSSEVSVLIKFKDVATGMFETNRCLGSGKTMETCGSVGNIIKLTVSPEQSIAVTLNAKAPGLGFMLEPHTLSFVCNSQSAIKNSYEKVLYDAIIGDQTLFTKTEEVLAAWRFITPILEEWQDLPLHQYEKGSVGPEKTIIQK
jgi:glucose-6-phosphate 1-dehydrogenase